MSTLMALSSGFFLAAMPGEVVALRCCADGLGVNAARPAKLPLLFEAAANNPDMFSLGLAGGDTGDRGGYIKLLNNIVKICNYFKI
jgi:hypothetical protein